MVVVGGMSLDHSIDRKSRRTPSLEISFLTSLVRVVSIPDELQGARDRKELKWWWMECFPSPIRSRSMETIRVRCFVDLWEQNGGKGGGRMEGDLLHPVLCTVRMWASSIDRMVEQEHVT